jgi:hypothetical protein
VTFCSHDTGHQGPYVLGGFPWPQNDHELLLRGTSGVDRTSVLTKGWLAGLLALLSENDPDLQTYALAKLNESVDLFWVEISDEIPKMWVFNLRTGHSLCRRC